MIYEIWWMGYQIIGHRQLNKFIFFWVKVDEMKPLIIVLVFIDGFGWQTRTTDMHTTDPIQISITFIILWGRMNTFHSLNDRQQYVFSMDPPYKPLKKEFEATHTPYFSFSTKPKSFLLFPFVGLNTDPPYKPWKKEFDATHTPNFSFSIIQSPNLFYFSFLLVWFESSWLGQWVHSFALPQGILD